PFARCAEADRERQIRPIRAVAAGAVVAGAPAGELALPVELFLRAVAAVGTPGGEQPLDRRRVVLAPLALEERPLVPLESEPFEPFEDRADGFRGRALAVGVLDAEEEAAAAPAREEVAEERRPGAADVEVARRARRE